MELLTIHAPSAGLWDGLEPTIPQFRETAASQLLNLRVAGGLWRPRLGMAYWQALPGTGRVRLLVNFYPTDGSRIRLAARGTTLYKKLEGTDASFVAVSGGTGLAASPANEVYSGTQRGNSFYLTDRSGPLKKVSVSGGVLSALETVAQPAAPTAAPRARRRHYGILEDWTSVADWTESASADFDIATTSLEPAEIDGAVARLRVKTTSAKSKNVARNSRTDPLRSHHIAFWFKSTDNSKSTLAFQAGINQPNEIRKNLHPRQRRIWYPLFVPVGAVPELNRMRFRVIHDEEAPVTVYVSPLVLPGRLDGKYRWIYTHYEPATGDESKPSPTSNTPAQSTSDGPPLDLSAEPISYLRSERADEAFEKCAILDFSSDSGTDASTTKIRIYRNGGSPALTLDERGQDVWCRVGEILDLPTTLDGAAAVDDQRVRLAAVSNAAGAIAAEDWLVIGKDETVAGTLREEYGRVADLATYTDLVIDAADSTKVTSATRPFQAGDVGQVLSVTGGTGFTVANHTVNSVAGGVATLSASAGTVGSTGGRGSLSSVNTTTRWVRLATPLTSDHASGAVAQVAFLDNVANESVNSTHRIERERDDPPVGAHFVLQAPDGRLVIARYADRPAGIAWSNRPTPERTNDHEVFPAGVDPITRQSTTQGWRADLGALTGHEEIVWAGFLAGTLTLLTKTAVYQVFAYSQTDWSPTAVGKVLDIGCIAGETVQEVGGALYWVSHGPSVIRWSGRGGPPEDVSHLRVSERLARSPEAYRHQWFARVHTKAEGLYYMLWFTPAGETTNTESLQYNTAADCWEPIVYRTAAGAAIPMAVAVVQSGSSDARGLYAAGVLTGDTWELDRTGLYTDEASLGAALAIAVEARSKRFPLVGGIGLARELRPRLEGVSADTLSVTVTTGGSEYGEIGRTYNFNAAGANDLERGIPLHRDLKGSWAELYVSGSVSARAALRELWLWWQFVRQIRVVE